MQIYKKYTLGSHIHPRLLLNHLVRCIKLGGQSIVYAKFYSESILMDTRWKRRLWINSPLSYLNFILYLINDNRQDHLCSKYQTLCNLECFYTVSGITCRVHLQVDKIFYFIINSTSVDIRKVCNNNVVLGAC